MQAPSQPDPRPRQDPFWRFARSLLRYRGLTAGAFTFVLLSGFSLSVGLLGAIPVMEAILGSRQHLGTLALRLNDWFSNTLPAFLPLRVPQGLIDTLPTDPFLSLACIMGALVLLTLVGSLCNYCHAYLSISVVNRAVTDLRRRAFHAVIRAPLWAVAARGTSDPVSRIVNDTTQLASGLTVLMSKAVLQVVKGIAALCVALFMDWRVTIAALTVAPLLYTIIRKLGKRIKRAANAALASQADLYGAATQTVQALRVVKVYNGEQIEAGRFHRTNKRMLAELNRVRAARALASPLTEALSVLLLCGLILVAGRAIFDNLIDPGRFILALGALAVAGASLKPLTGIINDIQTTQPAAARLAELIDTPQEPGHSRHLPRLARHARDIVLDDVCVTYPGGARPALRGVSLRIPHGARVALVGPNGSGKTTILGLIARLYDPDSGRVLIDGTDITAISVRSLRAQIGMVTQETTILRGTVRHNITFGASDDEQRMIAAARAARAHQFISALPRAYETLIGDGAEAAGLSGGQRQRIAIARAIMRDPAILVLDEATSMIDAESEGRIAEALAELFKGRTSLIVAHRPATIRACDLIVVMNEGAVEATGTHDSLMQHSPTYRALFHNPAA
ncbi:MAG: ABC transporter ATP-binding protein [Phycisphaeraceae bacterium]|nr:ABC transporter ATP-binding protein [Phycisphaeraceae bacterium]